MPLPAAYNSRNFKLSQLVGETLVNNEGRTTHADTLAGENKLVALMFSARWCPPCRAFMPTFLGWNRRLKQNLSGSDGCLNVIAVVTDREESTHQEYMRSLPSYFYFIPFEEVKRKVSLEMKCVTDFTEVGMKKALITVRRSTDDIRACVRAGKTRKRLHVESWNQGVSSTATTSCRPWRQLHLRFRKWPTLRLWYTK